MAFITLRTDSELQQHCARWNQCSWLAVDTEFVRVDTYHPILCLVQISDGQTHVCVDTLAMQDLSPLWALLANPRVIKVLHAASQDYEIFVQLAGCCPAPLFDTQVAATLLGLGDQIGYAGLVDKMLGIAVDKSLSRTNWQRRPLTEAELAYAAADVEHLSVIYPQLHQQLEAAGRLGWLAEDCARACQPAMYTTRPEDAWQRLKGLARMPAPAQHVAAALTQWREATAQARNRPRKWILEDDAVYRIAERQPRDADALARLQVLPPKTLEKHGAALLQCMEQALAGTGLDQPLETELSPAQKSQVQQLQDRLRPLVAAAQLPAGYLAPRADLVELALKGAAADIPLLRGWRRQVAGESLLAALT